MVLGVMRQLQHELRTATCIFLPELGSRDQYGLISSAREFRTGENLFLHVFPLLLFHQSLSIFSGETFFPQVDLKALFFKDRFFSQRHGV